MMNVAIISAGVLPLPAVKGGAVETLTDYIIKENEIENKVKLTVYSIYNKEAAIDSQKYRNCKFEYIRINKIIEKAYHIIIRIINKTLKTRSNKNKLYISKVCKVIGKNIFDNILIENRTEFVLPIRMSTKTKVSLHIHNDYLNSNTGKGMEIIEACDKVLTISNYIKDRVLTLGNKYCEKIMILKNCIDVNRFDCSHYNDFRVNFRKDNDISDDDVVIIFTGRIHPTKGVKELLLSFENISEKNCKLLVVGSSWYGSIDKTGYVREIEELSSEIQNKIIFTGFIPFINMPKIYAVADIAVTPSIWEEPAGLVIIEAMSTGLPVVTTNSGGIPEYACDDGVIMLKRDENLIANLTSSMEELIRNKGKRDTMGKAARRHALQYNTSKYYQDFLDTLSEDNAE